MSQLFTLPQVKNKVTLQKREAGVPDMSTLTEPQLKVFKGTIDCISGNSGGLVIIEGVAGSGKTYTISRIIERYLLNHPFDRVAFAATTNRAVEVNFKSTEYTHPCLNFSTIHRLLALKETILNDGSVDFFPDKFLKPAIAECAVVFIDECSQFSSKLWGYLYPYISGGVKVVLIGDPFQTPPVKETDSIVFTSKFKRDNNAVCYALTDIIRQAADNPIIKVASFVRANLNRHINIKQHFDASSDTLWRKELGVQCIGRSMSDKAYADELLRHIFTSANFTSDAAFGKCVAWRNKTVTKLNRGIRRMIYGNSKLRRIEPNEKIVSKQPIWNIDTDSIIINNGKQMEVMEFSRESESINSGQFTLHYYHTKVKLHDMYGNELIEHINIPTDLGVITFNEICEVLAANAKRYLPGSFAAKNAWGDFYKFQKTYANVQHDYAGTIHTVQGATINNVCVFAGDVCANHKIVERNKILYTGITRASERLFIL